MQYTKEERLPVALVDSIYPWMSAYVVLRHSPYMAKTDEEGRFHIENLPVGERTFQIWHERGGSLRKLSFDGESKAQMGKKNPRKLTITIQEGENDLGTAKITPRDLQIEKKEVEAEQ